MGELLSPGLAAEQLTKEIVLSRKLGLSGGPSMPSRLMP